MKTKEKVELYTNIWTVMVTYNNLKTCFCNASYYYFFLTEEDAQSWINKQIEHYTKEYKSATVTKDGKETKISISRIGRCWSYEPTILFAYDIRKQKCTNTGTI